MSSEDDVEPTLDAGDAAATDPGAGAGPGPVEPPEFDRRTQTTEARHKRAIFSVPLEVVVSVGRASPSIGELLNMRRDSLLELDTKVDDPVDIMVGRRVIARGELQEIEGEDGRLGVRLTEIVDLSEPF